MMLRVGLDLSAVPARPAGAGRYCIELAQQFDNSDDVSLTAITRKGDRERWRSLIPRAELVSVVPDSRPLRLAYEQLGLAGRVNRLPLDIYHGPHYTLPAQLRSPMVATVHDLTFFDHPEVHERSKVLYFRGVIRHATKRADGVICDSRRTANRLAELFDVSGEVTVAELGIDHDRFRHDSDSESDRELLRTLGVHVERPLVVAVGTLEPRKGLLTLLDAFEALASRHETVELVLAGQRGWDLAEFDARLSSSRFVNRVTVLGYVEEPVVPALYRQAAVVAYPSIDEGFGLPVVEALACGALVVTTADSVMSDLAGDAAQYVAAHNADELCRALESQLDLSESQRRAAAERASQRAERFTWASCATKSLDAYRQAMASKKSRSKSR